VRGFRQDDAIDAADILEEFFLDEGIPFGVGPRPDDPEDLERLDLDSAGLTLVAIGPPPCP